MENTIVRNLSAHVFVCPCKRKLSNRYDSKFQCGCLCNSMFSLNLVNFSGAALVSAHIQVQVRQDRLVYIGREVQVLSFETGRNSRYINPAEVCARGLYGNLAGNSK